jgi:mannose-6-phosphate isomerase-like protein (cupin superfamily)
MHRSRTIMIESELAHGEMPPLHVHAANESFHVFEGSLTVHFGEDAVRVEAGETFVAPGGVPHTYRAESDTSRVLMMSRVESAARYDDFLRAVVRPSDFEAPAWATAEDEATVSAIAAAAGITVLSAPGELPAARAASAA